MSEQPFIRRRTLPEALRHTAGKLTDLADTGGPDDLRGHALTLLVLADEAEGGTPEARHWLWTAIRSGEKVRGAYELHRPEMRGGLPTGKCAECSKPHPCPTAQAVAREPDGPCACGPNCPKNTETLAAHGEQTDPKKEQTV